MVSRLEVEPAVRDVMQVVEYLDQGADFDTCMEGSCLPIPMLLWIGWNMGFVLVASILVAFVEVSSSSGTAQWGMAVKGHHVRIAVRGCGIRGLGC